MGFRDHDQKERIEALKKAGKYVGSSSRDMDASSNMTDRRPSLLKRISTSIFGTRSAANSTKVVPNNNAAVINFSEGDADSSMGGMTSRQSMPFLHN